MTVLMDPTTNGERRWLIQDGVTLYVLSGCCKALINSSFKDEHSDHVWARCQECENLLQINDEGWDSNVADVKTWVGIHPTAWADWGYYWFGVKDFAMEVKR